MEIYDLLDNTLLWPPLLYENQLFAYAKTKTQISFAVTAKLISAFVFAIRIVQFLYYLNPKFQASSHLLWPHSLVCVGPGRKPRRPVFSERGTYELGHEKTCLFICKQQRYRLTWASTKSDQFLCCSLP